MPERSVFAKILIGLLMVFKLKGGATHISQKVQPEGEFRETQVPRRSYNSHQVHLEVLLEKYR